MHPLLSSRGRLVSYLLGWLPAAALLTGLVRLAGGQGWIEAALVAVPAAGLFAFICLAPWYVCRALPLIRTTWMRLAAAHLAAAFLSASLWLFLADTWVVFLEQFPPFAGLGVRFIKLIAPLLAAAVVLYVLIVALYYLAISFTKAQHAENDALRLEVLAREAELKALRAQIDPHFLFNSLNSISALITLDPAGARRMCELLAEFLRDGLRLGERPQITLGEELQLVERYLAIEKVRFGSRLSFERVVAPEVEDDAVLPLMLQPLVENAIRHGIARLIDGGTVRVQAWRRGEALVVSVTNPRESGGEAQPGTGVGLANVRGRLQARWGGVAGMTIRQDPSAWTVELEIPRPIPVAP